MEASKASEDSARRTCQECAVENLAAASFCKACGASITPPPKCPKCEAEVEADANFCGRCGTKLIGPRPDAPTNGATAAPPPPPAPKPADPLAAEKAKLPAAKPPSSNMMGNAALFVAFLIGVIAVIVAMNKDKPKEVSPFVGGAPAPNIAPPPPPPAAAGGDKPATADVPRGDPITGRITVAPAIADGASGTLFIVLRNAGMPNRGPPIAVRKISNPSFPLNFQVSASDVMMEGMPFMGPFDIYVRLDRDGNAMSKQPGDLVTEKPVSGIAAGTSGVEVTLDKRL